MAGGLDQQNGSGWIITVIEAMRAEWGCGLRQAMFEESLSAALTLWPAMLARHGAEIHFDHGDQARQDGKERMRKHLAEHYEISARTPPRPDFMRRSLPPLLPPVN